MFQAIDLHWAKNFGGTRNALFHSVAYTAYGYIAAGEFGDRNALAAIIVNYDLDGNVIWSKSLGSSSVNRFNSVAATTDGYVAAGVFMDRKMPWQNKGNGDAVIVKFDFDGNIVWAKSAGGREWDEYTSVVYTHDGYVAVGLSGSAGAPWGSNGNEDAIIVKYGLDGNMLWARNVGGSQYDAFYCASLTADGCYIAGGCSNSVDAPWGNNGETDAIIVKFDCNGNMIWAKNTGGPSYENFVSIAPLPDGYAAVGASGGVSGYWGNNGYNDAIIVRYNLLGDVMWASNTGGSDSDIFNSVTATLDGFIAVGMSDSTDAPWGNNGYGDGIIVKYDLRGNLVWAENIGGSSFDYLSSIATAGAGFIAAGASASTNAPWPNSGDQDAIILKFSETGENNNNCNTLLKLLLFILAARAFC